MGNRSSEEFAMRKAITKWGRKRWLDARVVHELVVGNTKRIDMAFIGPDYLVGVEIKSSKDTLDRLEDQLKCFSACVPLTILAIAPKWKQNVGQWVNVETLVVDPSGEEPVRGCQHFRYDRVITVPLLYHLWARELRNVAARLRISTSQRATMRQNIADIARRATGDEIVREVCRELRARDAFPKADCHPPSDAPIREAV